MHLRLRDCQLTDDSLLRVITDKLKFQLKTLSLGRYLPDSDDNRITDEGIEPLLDTVKLTTVRTGGIFGPA